MRRPFFSIVTPALNCARFLPRNLASVRSQGLPAGEIEHWVIDGGSKDETLELLRGAGVKFVSEPDQGLSDAVNKGIQRATGEWIIWLNADDELAPGALHAFMQARTSFPEIRMFCGGQKVFGYDGQLETINEGWDYNLKDLLGSRTAVVQASTFVHRAVYEKVGLLDVACRDAMDYEWTVRAAHHYQCQPLATVLTYYHRRPGSIMDANMAAFFRTFLRVRRRYGLSRFAPAEWRIRFYLATEPLRRVLWVRKGVRRIKRLFGREPAHPISGERIPVLASAGESIEVLHVVGGSSSLGGVMSFVRSLTEGDTSNVKHFIWKNRDFKAPAGTRAQWVCEGRALVTDISLASDAIGAIRDIPRLTSWLRRHPKAILHAHSRVGQIASTWIAWRTGRRLLMHMHARSTRVLLYHRLWNLGHACVVFNSPGTCRHFGRKPKTSQIVMPTIAWPAQPPAASRDAATCVRFVAAGVFVPLKNIHVIIDAFRRLTVGGLNAELVVFGRSAEFGNAGYQREMEDQSRSIFSIQIMDWDPGWTAQLTNDDVFVHAARTESFGIVILEAFARGCRLVVPQETFLDELPAPLNTAGIVRADPMDATSLAAAMKLAAKLPYQNELWELRQRARELFSAQLAGVRFAEIYEQLRPERHSSN